jgi:acetyl-CoA acyltransferase
MSRARDAVIVGAIRTAVGKRNGSLAGITAIDLSAHILNALAARTGINPADVDDVIWGCVGQVGEQSVNLGRNAVLSAGWPETVPAVTIDRQCGSSQQCVHFAAAGLIAGQYNLVVAGGVEMMSRVPIGANVRAEYGQPFTESLRERYGVNEFNQGLGAELMADRWKLPRTRLDEFSLASHEKAATAIDDHLFAEEIASVTLPDGTVFDTDEGVRRGTTLEKIASIKPAFKPDGVIHAGNASQISDGAAALLLTTTENAARLDLTPLARVHTVALAGADPVMMLGAPIPATKRALERSGLGIADIGAFEVNEAFAPVPLAWLAETGADDKALNPNGGAIALGHPLGASGARLMTTLVHHMRRNEIRYGLQTMCEGGGTANATIVELVG